MRKLCFLILSVSIVAVCVCGCSKNPPESMIKSQRRFAQYVEPQSKPQEGIIDLSEGPKTRYDTYFGPKSLDFDIKIKNPY